MPTTPQHHPRALTVLVALLTLVTLELVRSSGPLLDMAFSQGVVSAAGAALGTYLLSGLFAPVIAGRRVGTRSVVVGTFLLAAARLVVQTLDAGARFVVGLLTVALAVAVLTLAVSALASRGGAARSAVAAGLAASVGIQLALGTWDAYWRHDVVGWLVTLAVVGALVAAAWAARRDDGASQRVARVWALGPALGLSAMILANPAFAASQTGVPLAVAGAAVGVAWLLAAGLRPAPRRGWVEAVLLALLVAGTMVSAHAGGLVTLVAAVLVTSVVLDRALEPTAGAPGPIRTAGAAALVGLGTILPLLVYHLDYDVPLGVPNWLVLVATGALLGLAGVRRDPGHARPGPVLDRRHRAALLAAAGVVVLLGTGVAGAGALRSHSASRPVDYSQFGMPLPQVTVVSWNLHYGVSPSGDVNLEQVARTIEAQDACVVLLQEVSRGWVLGGGADMGSWLADRLGMRLEFAPAADRQFGNAVLSCTPARDVVVHRLPYGDGPQNRSAISASVDIGAQWQRFTSVHLQHREENTPTRLDQLGALLTGGDLGVVGGDLNAEPGWAEIDLLLDAGLVSAQDAIGDPDALTSPSTDPRHRIDWIFAPPGVELADFAVLTDALASDHLPLVVTVRPGAAD